jgi:hypothetical protein
MSLRVLCPVTSFMRPWEDIRMDLFGSMVGRCGLDSSGSGQVPVAGSCEHCNESSDSIKGGEFLDQLTDCQHRKDSAPWSYLIVYNKVLCVHNRMSGLKIGIK